MSEESKTASIKTNVAGLLQLFGPPPVLSSESIQAYEEAMTLLLGSFLPQDFMEQLLIKEVGDSTWEAARYARHKTLQMERRFRARLAHQAQRRQVAAERKMSPAETPAEQNGKPPTDPEDVLAGLVEQIDGIVVRPATELEHARALEVGIVYHQHLDKAHLTALARRDKALEQLERYRDGLGRLLRQVSDQIIEAHANVADVQGGQVTAPPISSDEQ
jgi:hypothetical protein